MLGTTVPGPFQLAEGPLWDERTGSLLWVDIVAGRVFRHWPDRGATESVETGEDVGCVALTERHDVVIAALRSGWHWLDLETGERSLIAAPEALRPRCRFNDGAVDSAGRFWTGTLEDGETHPVGRLYRLSPDLTFDAMDHGFLCSNGIDWSLDDTWMFFVDSRRNAIYRYAFDAETGQLGERLLFADTSLLSGIPDGICIDADGLLWCAFWDGGVIRAFDMSGQVTITIAVPALRPTSIAFGGKDLGTIYVTTARLGLSDEQLAEWPASGSVLELRSEHRGRPAHVFGS